MKGKYLVSLTILFLIIATGGALNPGEAEERSQQLKMVTARGIPYMVGLAMENLSNRFARGIKVDTASVGDEETVLKLLSEGKADLGLVTMTEILKAFPKPRDRERAGLRLVMGGHAAIVAHIFVRRDVPINAVADLRGRRVGVPEPGSKGEALAKAILENYDLAYKDIKPIFMGVQEQVKAFEMEFVDALLLVVPVPSPIIPSPTPVKIAALGKSKLLSLEENLVKELTVRYPGYSRHRIEPNTYPGQAQGVTTVARKNAVIARRELRAELSYAFVKAILEHPTEFATLCPLAMAYTPKNALPGTSILPLHPGAESYYREQRIL